MHYLSVHWRALLAGSQGLRSCHGPSAAPGTLGRWRSSPASRPRRLIGVSFYVIAAYVAVEAVRSLVGGDEPSVSWVGIGLAAVTAVTMPPLAVAKGRVGAALSSSATASEGRQNMLCAARTARARTTTGHAITWRAASAGTR
jgi:hypothetical protein